MMKLFKRSLTGILLSGALASSASGQDPVPGRETGNYQYTSLAGWQADLDLLDATIRDHHPALQVSQTRESWSQAVESVRRDLPLQSPAQRLNGLSRLVASLGDGHTNLIPFFGGSVGFEARLPVRAYDFDDGLVITEAEAAHTDLLGTRIVAINGMELPQLRARFYALIGHENDQWARNWFSVLVTQPAYLEAVGAIGNAGATTIIVEDESGAARQIVLETSGADASRRPARSDAAIARARPPADPDIDFDLAVIDGGRAVYIALNAIADGETETLAEFSHRMARTVEATGARRIIFDVRRNGGGNNHLNEAIIRDVIRLGLDHPGGTVVLVGRQTFSAAMNFVTEAEQHLDALFIGETTGAAPNHFGDPAMLMLPRTGLPLLYSTLYWQASWPNDSRPGLVPDVVVPVSFEDWLAGRDRVIEAAVGYPYP